MDGRDIVYLIDPDNERRAAIADCLDSPRYRIEPPRSVAELARAGSRSGIALVHDGAAAVRDLIVALDDDDGSAVRILAFGEAADVPRVVAAVRDGAQDYLIWPFCGATLAAALDRTSRRDRPSRPQPYRKQRADAWIERLTPRERQVLTALAQGISNRQMGQKLGISPRTVEIHRANMITKIGARHTSEAIRVAFDAALVD